MSDERRDVARRLLECRRDAREYDDREADVALAPKLVMKNGNSMYRNVAGSLEEGGNFSLGYEQAIYRLADLIDPTCEANSLADGRQVVRREEARRQAAVGDRALPRPRDARPRAEGGGGEPGRHHEPPVLPDAMAHRVHHMAPGPDRQRLRGRTYPGIARAMAEQWAGEGR